MMKRKWLIAVSVFFINVAAAQQRSHYTQYILNNYILNPEYRPSFRKCPELHREVLATIAYLQQSHNIQQLEKLARRRPPFDRRLTQERFLALTLEFLEENYDDILHYYDDLFEKCNGIIQMIISLPYLKNIAKNADAPQHPYKRTLWMMLNRLKSLMERLGQDRARVKYADEEGSFSQLLLHESSRKPLSVS
jgi:hypothetical protein